MKQNFQLLLSRINIRETKLPAWDWFLGFTLVVVYGVVLLTSLLLVATLTEDSLDAINPEVIAYAHLLGCLITLVLIYQYTTLALQKVNPKSQKFATTLTEALRLNPTRNTPIWAIMFLAFSLAVMTDTLGIVFNVPFESLPTPLDNIARTDTLPFFSGLLVIVVLRPIVEELIFRGILYTSLIKQFTPVQAIFISSIAFAIVHLLFSQNNLWWGFIQPLVLGLVASTARASTKSTQPAIGAHFMFGVFTMLRALIQ